jgi:hypothetical protein
MLGWFLAIKHVISLQQGCVRIGAASILCLKSCCLGIESIAVILFFWSGKHLVLRLGLLLLLEHVLLVGLGSAFMSLSV